MEPAILIFAFVLVLVCSTASAALTWGLCSVDYKRQLARELEAKDRAHRHHLAEIRDALAVERQAREKLVAHRIRECLLTPSGEFIKGGK